MHSEKWYNAAQIRQIEAVCLAEKGIDPAALMAQAGRAAWAVLLQRWPHAQHIMVVCGTGNNGGDGYVLAAHAHHQGKSVCVIAMGPPRTAWAQAAAARVHQAGVPVLTYEETRSVPMEAMYAANPPPMGQPDVLVDALLGIGVQGPLRPMYQSCVSWMNQLAVPCLAIDLPSGLHADTGQVTAQCAVRASATITFLGRKTGCFLGQGGAYTGALFFSDLGVATHCYQSIPHCAFQVSQPHLKAALPPRHPLAHKGHCGHVLVVGGEAGMWGAAYLAAKASLQMGAGWVSVATRAAHAPLFTAKEPALMSHAVHTPAALRERAARATVIVIGPGLGQGPWAQQMLQTVLEDAHCQACPKIIDADALNLLANWPHEVCLKHAILTPHPGEACRLLQAKSSREITADPVSALQRLQQRWRSVVVLKGAVTLIGAGPQAVPDQGYAVSPQPNPAMAVGGMGDVLAGILGALVAQSLSPPQAASFPPHSHAVSLAQCAYAGVYLHQQAGQRARQEKGVHSVLPTDVLTALPTILKNAVAS